MSDNGTQARGSGHWLRTAFIALATGIVVAATTPVIAKLLENKPPAIPGGPANTWEPTVYEGKYALTATVKVANRTIDPVNPRQPLNAKDALTIRHGDKLSFDLYCSITPNDGEARLSIFMLAVPSGLKIAEEPRLTTASGTKAEVAINADGLAWAWIVAPEVGISDNARGSFTATVETDQPAYLTVTWGCPAQISDREIVPGISRAILKIERS